MNPQLCGGMTDLPKGWLKAGEEYSWHFEGHPVCSQPCQGASLVLHRSFLLLTFGKRFALAQE